MDKWDIEKYYSPPHKFLEIPIKEYVVFNAIEPETGKDAGCAEFSSSSMSFFIKDKPIKNQQWFFNRLYIKPEFRNRGAATALLEQVKKFVYEKDICLYCDVNPYGDLNHSQLNTLYKKHGFQRKRVTCDTNDVLFYGLFMNYKL